MKDAENTKPVLIAGAGPAGLMMACQLALRRTGFRIIDRKKSPSVYSGAMIIHAPGIELLADLGLSVRVLQKAIPLHTLNLRFRDKKTIRLHVKNIGLGHSRFPDMLMLEQSETERLLLNSLSGHGHQVEWNTELTGFSQDEHGVTAILKHPDGKQETVRSSYLIAADGGNSTIRSTLNIAFHGRTHRIPLCISDCRADLDIPEHTACLSFSSHASAGFFPLPAKRRRIDFSLPRMKGQLNFNAVAKYLHEKSGLKLSSPDWFSVFHSHSHYALSFRSSRCFLIGDAAHVFSPVGARGMNCGWQDAANLAWKISLAVAGKATPLLLDSYEQERKPVAMKTAKATDLLFRLAASPRVHWKLLRLYILPYLAVLVGWLLGRGVSRTYLFRIVSGAGIRYPTSPLNNSYGNFGGQAPVPGERLPFVWFQWENRPDADQTWKKKTWLLIIFSKKGSPEEMINPVKPHAELITCSFVPFREETKDFYELFGIKNCGYYLVRPDGYIACRSDHLSPHSLKTCFRNYLIF